MLCAYKEWPHTASAEILMQCRAIQSCSIQNQYIRLAIFILQKGNFAFLISIVYVDKKWQSHYRYKKRNKKYMWYCFLRYWIYVYKLFCNSVWLVHVMINQLLIVISSRPNESESSLPYCGGTGSPANWSFEGLLFKPQLGSTFLYKVFA